MWFCILKSSDSFKSSHCSFELRTLCPKNCISSRRGVIPTWNKPRPCCCLRTMRAETPTSNRPARSMTSGLGTNIMDYNWTIVSRCSACRNNSHEPRLFGKKPRSIIYRNSTGPSVGVCGGMCAETPASIQSRLLFITSPVGRHYEWAWSATPCSETYLEAL